MRISNLIIFGVLAFALFTCCSQNKKNSVNSIGTTKDDTSETADFCADCNKKPVHEYRNALDTIPSEYINSDWMRVYADYILDSIHRNYQSFAICYIDNDDIPELCLYGLGFGDGAIILSQQNGVVSHYRSYWSPQYIERKGFIDDGYSYGGTGVDNIVKLVNGEFQVVLQTQSVFHYGTDTCDQYFEYWINDELVDKIFGKNADYGSSKILEDAIKKKYSSKGSSIAILDSPQGVYYTKTLLCELFCEGE